MESMNENSHEINDDDYHTAFLKILGIPQTQSNNPLFSINFYNNTLSAKVHSVIEKKLKKLVLKFSKENNFEPNKINSGNSSVIYKELHHTLNESETSIINCSHYFNDHIVDRTGLPMIENLDVSNWFESIEYSQEHPLVLTDNLEFEIVSKIPEKGCFNCGASNHNLSACPEPKNFSKISEKRKVFFNSLSQTSSCSSARYHEQMDDKPKFIPGVISSNLKQALGIFNDQLPPYIYKMRCIGYPPGYLYKSQSDSFVSVVGSSGLDSLLEESIGPSISINESVILYPGFNTYVPSGIKDQSNEFGFPRINPRIFPNQYESDTISSSNLLPQPEDVIRLNQSSMGSQVRGYFFEPLSVNMFPPKRSWRNPPSVLEVPTIEQLSQIVAKPFKLSENVFVDEEIPTDRLEKIIKYLRTNVQSLDKS